MNRGFTLIELLVVISIIGMLSSIILASVKTARDKAGNVAANEIINQYSLALQQYYLDNGYYPLPSVTLGGYVCLGDLTNSYYPGKCGSGSGNSDINVDAAFSKYMSQMPLLKPATAYASNPQIHQGPEYRCTVLDSDGRCAFAVIRWFVDGANMSCGRGGHQTTDITAFLGIFTKRALAVGASLSPSSTKCVHTFN